MIFVRDNIKKKRFKKCVYCGKSDYIKSNFYRDERNAIVNSFESPRRSCRKIKLTTTNEDMSYENMPRLQTERFERQIPTFIANDNIQTVNERILVPMLTTTKVIVLNKYYIVRFFIVILSYQTYFKVTTVAYL